MGLFDHIKVNSQYLKFPDDTGELKDYDWSDVKFMTKDLDCVLGDYEIRRKRLYTCEIESKWVEDDTSPLKGKLVKVSEKLVALKITKDITFYSNIETDKFDYWVEWVAVIKDGRLDDVKLVRWKERDNTERKQLDEELARRIAKGKARSKALWFKIYRHLYVTPVVFVFEILDAMLINTQKILHVVKRKVIPFQ